MTIPKPSDINIQEHLWNCFGHNETEISAYWIIKLMLETGNEWRPFTERELNELYHKSWPNERFNFNRLFDQGHLVKKASLIHIQPSFVGAIQKRVKK